MTSSRVVSTATLINSPSSEALDRPARLLCLSVVSLLQEAGQRFPGDRPKLGPSHSLLLTNKSPVKTEEPLKAATIITISQPSLHPPASAIQFAGLFQIPKGPPSYSVQTNQNARKLHELYNWPLAAKVKPGLQKCQVFLCRLMI